MESPAKARSILSAPEGYNTPGVRVARLTQPNEDALRLLQEYYEAVNVVLRDTPETIQRIVDDPGSGVWLAYMNGKAVGCVVLRGLSSIPAAGECKRLYVQPSARGLRIADKLLDAQEEFARGQGLRWIYLDSYDDLKAAIALYRRRGYVFCERYNDNPQATVFLRKDIGMSGELFPERR
jgi:GNAT superfamily N-acetyltransferase